MEDFKIIRIPNNYKSKKSIESFFISVNSDFYPSLIDRINSKSNLKTFTAYIDKILENGFCYGVEFKSKIVGLLVLYANDLNANIAYIPILSIHRDYHNMGLATRLMKIAQRDAMSEQMRVIKVETWKENINAINFYKKNQFEIIHSTDEKIEMRLTL
jgi:ribosomal protein S18 acetylase RimI-like enzyme